MQPLQVVPSTTSHKHEPLIAALEVFARLGFHDLDLNLNHLIEGGVPVDAVRQALRRNAQRVHIVSGGWCDFFDGAPKIQETFASVERQVGLARAFGVDAIRLFFGRLGYERWSAPARQTIVANIQRLATEYPDMRFLFENHDGASAYPHVCEEILSGVDQANVFLNFDPINFAHRGVEALEAAQRLLPSVAHVHLKGYRRGQFCEFGEGDVDLVPTIECLVAGGYRGGFTVEYEGPMDRTLRLYLGVVNARAVLERLSSQRSQRLETNGAIAADPRDVSRQG